MPNYCSCDLRLKGKKEAISTLIDWMKADYGYQNSPFCCLKEDENTVVAMNHHFYRVFSVINESESSSNQKGQVLMHLHIICAWSFRCCFMEGEHTYYSENHQKNLDQYGMDFAITIDRACKELALELEGYSYEDGMEFAEYIHITADGTIDTYRCESCKEVRYDDYFCYQDYVDDLTKHNMQQQIVSEEEYRISKDGQEICYLDSPLLEQGQFVFKYLKGAE